MFLKYKYLFRNGFLFISRLFSCFFFTQISVLVRLRHVQGSVLVGPCTPAIQKAQHNLCRKLGLLDSELQPIEAALQEFIAKFDGPLPQEIIASLAAMFNIDNDNAQEIDQALVGLVDVGVAELQVKCMSEQVHPRQQRLRAKDCPRLLEPTTSIC